VRYRKHSSDARHSASLHQHQALPRHSGLVLLELQLTMAGYQELKVLLLLPKFEWPRTMIRLNCLDNTDFIFTRR